MKISEIRWIKITTDIFDDEKIKIIDTMPARDEILVIWFKLLSLAGKVNQNGLLFMNSRVAYTIEMLSAIFNRELSTVRLAISTFEKFEMIEITDNEIISIIHWEKHQNIEGMDKIREQTRNRVAKHREVQKQISSNVTSNVIVTKGNAIDKEKEKEKDKDKDKDKKNIVLQNKFEAGSFEIRCVNYLIDKILEVNKKARVPSSDVDKQKWAIYIDKLKRLDKKEEEEIAKVMEFAVTNEFWKSNILSTSKLRDKYDTLFAQMKRSDTKKPDAIERMKDW